MEHVAGNIFTNLKTVFVSRHVHQDTSVWFMALPVGSVFNTYIVHKHDTAIIFAMRMKTKITT